MNDNYSLFDEQDEVSQSLAVGGKSASKKLDVIKMDFQEALTLSWEELFDGFDKLYAITYSSGMDFICALLGKFKYAEIIFGCDEVMSYSLQEIMAYQLKTIERLREKISAGKLDLLRRIDSGDLKLLVARKLLSHEKIYLLEAEDGRKRVVMGSANMSYSAFSGRQRENICYLDGDKAFDWYKESFEELKADSSDDITTEMIALADDGENLEEIPVMKTIAVKKALVVEPVAELKEEVRFVLDVKNLAGKFAPFMPKADKKGKIALSPEIVKQTRRRIEAAKVQDSELRSEYPQLVMDAVNQSVTLNDKMLDLNPDADSVKGDVQLFMEYMGGFDKFHGDVSGMQGRYFEFANWFFASPFMASMRNMAVRYSHNLLPYPVFGLVYGQSKAGKTSFLEILLKMMIGQKTKISAPDFTRSSIEQLKRAVKGAPIVVDDLTNTRFSQHAIETIKNDDFGVAENLQNYPAVVISANEDVKAVAPEIIRRTVICRVQAGLTNTELMKSSIVRKVQKNITTAFYREYLRRMLERLPELLQELKEDEAVSAPDILELSSNMICDIIGENIPNALPPYMRRLTLDDYFSEKVTGSYTIKVIQNAWKVNKKAFIVDKKLNQLRYNAGQTWKADRLLKELPEDIEAQKSKEWIMMDLSKACDFFATDFRKMSLLDRFRRGI
ncbi:MAG: restriction endonuclease PLD domain-containing protein [Eubacteriales bacterium]